MQLEKLGRGCVSPYELDQLVCLWIDTPFVEEVVLPKVLEESLDRCMRGQFSFK
ncbi:hypothetical protein PC128_g13158 [Phytophthora cactorum]|nr:hypothetical protein PC128_g13158 [Phytophthora cactorum]